LSGDEHIFGTENQRNQHRRGETEKVDSQREDEAVVEERKKSMSVCTRVTHILISSGANMS